MHSLKLGIRPSRLALKQAEEIIALFPSVNFKIVKISTSGDKDKITPLTSVEGSDFFTKEIDLALLNGEIDLAVHSSKDLPEELSSGLKIVLETSALSSLDALVSKGKRKLGKLAPGSRIGTSSQRRKENIVKLRQDLKIVDVRGNIEERLKLIDEDRIDALIVAHAALIRLELEYRITELFGSDIFPVHPKQGSLTVLSSEDGWQKVKSIL